MDLQEQHQPELVKEVAKVKARTRPWRAIIFSTLAIIAAGVSWVFGHGLKSLFQPGHLADSIVTTSAAIAFLIFATTALLAFANRARQALQPVTGSAHAGVVRYAVVLGGLIGIVAITLVLLKVPVSQLLVGTAFATIIVTIAGQQSLSNIFAGLVLLLSHPFRVGDTIRLRSGALGGQHEGTVTEIGITYLRLDTGDEVMSLPNSQVMAAAVSCQPTAGQPGDPDHDRPARPSLPTAPSTAATGPAASQTAEGVTS